MRITHLHSVLGIAYRVSKTFFLSPLIVVLNYVFERPRTWEHSLCSSHFGVYDGTSQLGVHKLMPKTLQHCFVQSTISRKSTAQCISDYTSTISFFLIEFEKKNYI